MLSPVRVTGGQALPSLVDGDAVLAGIALRLAQRVRSVERLDARVKFRVGWNEYRNRTSEWVSAVDGGEFWIGTTVNGPELR